MLYRWLFSLLTFLALSAARAPGQDGMGAADRIIKNGKIWTVNTKQPEAEALAIRGERIVAVGSDADILKLAGPQTKVHDLQQRRVVPGFHDSHLHLLSSGLQLSQIKLKDARDEAEFGRRLKDHAAKLPPGRWLLGNDWDHDRTFGGTLPTSAVIDKYVADRPVFLRRYDGHMGVANTQAIKLAGIAAATPDPAGGVIYRDTVSKQPTGLLRDNAMALVGRLIPPPEPDAIQAAVLAALVEIRRNGITSVQDMDGSSTATRQALFRVYQQLHKSGQLTCRIRLHWPMAAWRALADLGVLMGYGDLWLQIGVLKDFMDGSLGSSTAKMFEPYLNEPTSTGIYVRPRSQLLADALAADKAGLGLAIHGIGDRGNAELLDIFAQVIRTNGPRDRRFRLEHAQHLRPVDFKRFAELGVIASMQPYHLIDDGRWAEGRIGAKRCASSYALRSLLDAGARVAFGSDWSVAPLSPLLGIDAAVNRRTLDGKNPGGWFPEQKITVAQALECYTLMSAFAASQEQERGSLAVGKLADLVVLSRDILDPAERDHIAEADVVATMVGGKFVYNNHNHEPTTNAGAARPASQNPSPMVEHTRTHTRLKEERPPGKRIPLRRGTLYLPENLPAGPIPLFVHFHGGTWLPEVAAQKVGSAVIAIQRGAGSVAYARPFADRQAFADLLKEAEAKSGRALGPIALTSWSAGYGATRAILKVPEYYDRIAAVLLLDGLHAGYVGGKPGPKESTLVTDDLAIFVTFAKDAAAGTKRLLVTHTEIFPGTFASTTETADYLLAQLGLRRQPVLRWGPLGTQILSEVTKGRFKVLGFAGNAAPDHVDVLHALPELLAELTGKN